MRAVIELEMGKACRHNDDHVIYDVMSPVVVGFLFRNRLCISGVRQSKPARLMAVYTCIFAVSSQYSTSPRTAGRSAKISVDNTEMVGRVPT